MLNLKAIINMEIIVSIPPKIAYLCIDFEKLMVSLVKYSKLTVMVNIALRLKVALLGNTCFEV